MTYPFASYIDILVEFGYPLVAETLEEVRLSRRYGKTPRKTSAADMSPVVRSLQRCVDEPSQQVPLTCRRG